MARCWLDFHDPKKTVILAGCGRSGTTWLGDVMNYRNTFRAMFEPFYPAKVPALAAAGWRAHQYLRPGGTGACADQAERIFSGRIRNDWIDQFNRRPVAHRRLIKDIRANFILGWVHARHPALKIIYLLRHPIPTVLSQLKMGWNPSFDLFHGQPELMADFLEPYRGELGAIQDAFSGRLMMWCLMNLVPLRQFAGGGMQVIFYEDLFRRHAEILPGLLAHIEVRHTDWVLSKLSLPSPLTKNFSAILHGEDPVESWRKQVTPEQMKTAMEILARFGFDRIYGEDSMPRVKAEDVLGMFKD